MIEMLWTQIFLIPSLKVVVALVIAIALLYGFRRRITAHILRNPKAYVIATPFLCIILIVVLFASIFYPGSVAIFNSVEKRGQFGDSFGALNTVFTGLGFAGLTLTLILQQTQLRNQARQLLIEQSDVSVARYDSTLYKLLELYKDCVQSVLLSSEGKRYEGLNAIKFANQMIYKKLRIEKVAAIPAGVRKNLQKNELTESDKKSLDRLFRCNAELINAYFQRQGRLIKTFTLLLSHLEDQAPNHLDLNAPRALIQSQLTHIEISYFFLVSLAFSAEDDLRRLLRSSGLMTAFQNVYELELHRFMYLQLWDFDPKPLPRGTAKIPFKSMATIPKMQAKTPVPQTSTSDDAD